MLVIYLEFSFEGEGEVVVALSSTPSDFQITGADSVTTRTGNEIGLHFRTFGTHKASVVWGSESGSLSWSWPWSWSWSWSGDDDSD